MQISFTTKEQTKARQREAFLELSPVGRFQHFLGLMEGIDLFEGLKNTPVNKNFSSKNFIIEKSVIDKWKKEVNSFIELASVYKLEMLLVGGGAVNFHGYQRHSADVDFWFKPSSKNFQKLIKVLKELGYDIEDFPSKVKRQEQNISLKFSPSDFNIELITRFSLNKTFDEALKKSHEVIINQTTVSKINVLSLEDLFESKLRAGRPKDLLDIQQLKEIHNLE